MQGIEGEKRPPQRAAFLSLVSPLSKRRTKKMDMGEKKEKPLWLFTDNASDLLPLPAVFIDCKQEISKNGANQFPVITLDSAGQLYKVSRWKTDCSACVAAWGVKSEEWIGKQVSLRMTDKGAFLLTPMQEELK